MCNYIFDRSVPLSSLLAFLDEAERKYLFECDSEEQCREWMDSIIKARYSSMNGVIMLKISPEVLKHCDFCMPLEMI